MEKLNKICPVYIRCEQHFCELNCQIFECKKNKSLSYKKCPVTNINCSHSCNKSSCYVSKVSYIHVEHTINTASLYFNMSKDTLIGRRRVLEVATARNILIKLLYDECKLGWSEIARMLERNHSTIIKNYDSINDLIFLYKNYRQTFNNLKTLIQNETT